MESVADENILLARSLQRVEVQGLRGRIFLSTLYLILLHRQGRDNAADHNGRVGVQLIQQFLCGLFTSSRRRSNLKHTP